VARSKLDTPTKERIVQAIRLGATAKLAAQYAGISAPTFWRWMARGEEEEEDPESIYRSFRDSIQAAEADCAIRDLTHIERAARAGDWRAAKWRLAVRFPADFSETMKIEAHTRISPLEALEARAEEINRDAILPPFPDGDGAGDEGDGSPSEEG